MWRVNELVLFLFSHTVLHLVASLLVTRYRSGVLIREDIFMRDNMVYIYSLFGVIFL